LTLIEKIGRFKVKPLIFYAPLDWGLGHTTRSIPLIKELQKQGCEVIVGCNSTQKAILEPELPEVSFVEMNGYGLRYGRTRIATRMNLFLQIPKILIAINAENQWINRFLVDNNVDAVISDNRYGMYSASKYSVLITHQLNIRTGFGNIINRVTNYFVKRLLDKFNECWIPDFENEINIAGKLSHPSFKLRIPVKYLGCLSRFETCSNSTVLYDLLVILSGPEPQRSILEKKITDELRSHQRKAVIVRGLPGNDQLTENIPGIIILNHASAIELNKYACNSALIICRSGYTTIMDMLKLRKKMIVIPTPGQPEQEYLADHLSAQRFVISFKQDNFSIEAAVQKASAYEYRYLNANMNVYKDVLTQFVNDIKNIS
jgi:UDP-N-acetylglucosamine transferase subunit ALG13